MIVKLIQYKAMEVSDFVESIPCYDMYVNASKIEDLETTDVYQEIEVESEQAGVIKIFRIPNEPFIFAVPKNIQMEMDWAVSVLRSDAARATAAAQGLSKELHKYRNATFWQRLKYLFTKEVDNG